MWSFIKILFIAAVVAFGAKLAMENHDLQDWSNRMLAGLGRERAVDAATLPPAEPADPGEIGDPTPLRREIEPSPGVGETELRELDPFAEASRSDPIRPSPGRGSENFDVGVPDRPSLTEPLQLAKDNGAKRALIPIENKRTFLEVPGDVVEHVDPVFYGDPKTAAMKVLGLT